MYFNMKPISVGCVSSAFTILKCKRNEYMAMMNSHKCKSLFFSKITTSYYGIAVYDDPKRFKKRIFILSRDTWLLGLKFSN